MVAMAKPGHAVSVVRRCGKDILPAPFPVGIRVFAKECVREGSSAEAFAHILLVELASLLQMREQRLPGS